MKHDFKDDVEVQSTVLNQGNRVYWPGVDKLYSNQFAPILAVRFGNEYHFVSGDYQ